MNSIETTKNTINYDQTNKEGVYGTFVQDFQEGKSKGLQEFERGDPQEGTCKGTTEEEVDRCARNKNVWTQ